MASRSFYNAIWAKRNALGDLLGYPREFQKNIPLFLDKVLADADDIARWESLNLPPEIQELIQPQLEEKKESLQWLEDRLAKLDGQSGVVEDGAHQPLRIGEWQTTGEGGSATGGGTTDKNDEVVVKQKPEQYNQFKRAVQEDIETHYPLVINHQLQDKHIRGSVSFDPDRGELTVDPEELIKLYAGKGEPIMPKSGVWNHRERFIHTSVIGIWRDITTGESAPTTVGIIHYSQKRGVHIVPAKPIKE